MILYDITMTIKPDMTVYKNRAEKKPRLPVTRDFDTGDLYESRLEIDLHTGTHIDMPLHIIPGGDSSDQWSVDQIFTRCTVWDFSLLEGDALTAEVFAAKENPPGGLITAAGYKRSLLLKTKNSFQDQFDFSFIYLEQSGAAYLAEKQVAAVGIDALGIERDQSGHETHNILLKAGILIIEGLRLGEVPEGDYILAMMPLKIAGAEALPVRAVLLAPDSLAFE